MSTKKNIKSTNKVSSKNITDSNKTNAAAPPPTPASVSSPVLKKKSNHNVKYFLIITLLILLGYKLYYFNLSLEFINDSIRKQNVNNLFFGGSGINNVTKDTINNYFGKDIGESLLKNLEKEHDDWFDYYIYNLKLDFSYYFLKILNVLNKLKLTRYLFTSLIFGGILFAIIMVLLYGITMFFTIYGLIRVFTINIPFLIFAAITPLLLIHILPPLFVIYYTFKMVVLKRKWPTNIDTYWNSEWKKNMCKKREVFEKIILLLSLTIYPLINLLTNNNSNGGNISKIISYIIISLLVIIILGYTFILDLFMSKDLEIIWKYIKNNKSNLFYIIFIGVFIWLFNSQQI